MMVLDVHVNTEEEKEMKPFNLEKALAGEYCVTRSGNKAKAVYYLPELDKDVFFGFVIEGATWHACVWNLEGFAECAPEVETEKSDIIGMWEDKQPEVTVTFPAPLKEVKEGQEVWSYGFNPTECLLNPDCNHIYSMTFKAKIYFHTYLLETGQLFATKEDAEASLKAMKGARR